MTLKFLQCTSVYNYYIIIILLYIMQVHVLVVITVIVTDSIFPLFPIPICVSCINKPDNFNCKNVLLACRFPMKLTSSL